MGSLLTQFYQGQRFMPDEILLPVELEDRDTRAEYLSERKGKNVSIQVPQKGDKRKLVEMARAKCPSELYRTSRSGESP